MASTQVRTLIGTTGASGAPGYTGLVAAHNTALATAVTTAQNVAGVVISTILINNTILTQDSNAGLLYMTSAVNYITNT